MSKPEEKFKEIALQLQEEYDTVSLGKMMSAPGIKYRDKVVAFFYKEKMIFRLGKEYNISQHGISEYTHLNPFKNRPPMKGWYEVAVDYSDKWMELALAAIEVIKTEQEK